MTQGHSFEKSRGVFTWLLNLIGQTPYACGFLRFFRYCQFLAVSFSFKIARLGSLNSGLNFE